MIKLVFFGFCAVCIVLWSQWPVNEQSVMQDFMYGGDRRESELTIPLKNAGSAILPGVLAAVQDKNMPRRRYAIGFLGQQGYQPALPVLETILEDKTEIEYFRADALEAIFLIAPDRAALLSPLYIDQPELLGRFARNIFRGKPPPTLD